MIASKSSKIQVTKSQSSASGTNQAHTSVTMKDINDMENKADQLRQFNARIRVAAIGGAVEEIMVQLERRRAFLDTLSKAMDRPSESLVTALQDALIDNEDLLTGLEKVMDIARKRGRINSTARQSYRKNQTKP